MSSLAEARDRALLYIRLLPLAPLQGVALALSALEEGAGKEDSVAVTMERLIGAAPSVAVAAPVPPLERGAVVPEELETSPFRAFVAARKRRLADIAEGDPS